MAETRTLTRAESQERTRQALLDAAARRFSEQGYLGTTLAQVAADAGLTKEAVYANFTSKADLFLEVRKEWSFSGLPEAADRLAGVTDIETCMNVVADWIATFADESA
ncbi:MAG TPA: TetR family transcriptional regulator, partial [Acidimicrobiales bacterium]|nr:TetR family transcriptional regulator [Acidimicrobiales bacterium]